MKSLQKIITVSILLIMFILILMFVGNYISKLKDLSKDKICYNSLLSSERSAKLGLTFDSKSINCPPTEFELKKTGNEKILAEEMKRCWEKFGKGQLNLFKGEGVFCSVCSFAKTKKKVEINNFYNYLSNNNVKGTSETYIEYFQEGTTNYKSVLEDYKEELKKKSIFNTKFNVDNDYAIIFRTIKGYDAWKRVLDSSKTTAIGVGTSVAGLGVTAIGIGLINSGGVLSATGVGAAIGVPSIAAGVVLILGGAVYSIVQYNMIGNNFEWYSQVMLRPYNEKTLKEDLHCEYIPVRLLENE